MNKRMSFDKYIDNPSGGMVYTNRNMYKNMYKDKFNKILVREMGTIKYELFTANDAEDSHYIYFKIPSEVIENFYYDVVIRLFTNENKNKSNARLREYSVQFYSNDPAFMYTFAHSFAKNNLFIKDLEPRMSKQALKQKAAARNPRDDVWYVKSLFFAYLAMEKYNLFAKSVYSGCKKYDKKYLLNNIMQAETKVRLRQEAEEEKKKKEKTESKQKPNKVNTNNNISVDKTKKSRNTKSATIVKPTKSSRTTKKSHIIGTKKR